MKNRKDIEESAREAQAAAERHIRAQREQERQRLETQRTRRGPTRYKVEIAGQVFMLSSPVDVRIEAPANALPDDVIVRIAERAKGCVTFVTDDDPAT